MIKRCFYCKKKLPLFMYKVNRRKYQRPADKGRCVGCRICRLKSALRGPVVTLENNDFKVKHLTRREIITEFFTK